MYPISTFYPSRPIVRDGDDEGGGGFLVLIGHQAELSTS